jgi:hypothetical protein
MPKLVAVTALICVLAAFGAGSGGAKPREFVSRVDNPWFPLPPGTTLVYRGVKDGRSARDVVTVTRRTKTIQGARCTVVRDNRYLHVRLAERTTDSYAKHRAGNLWYFGEATAELDRSGRVKSREGSWQAGVHGALPGIYMPAHPAVGQRFRQEYYKGQAEDHFEVLSLSAPVSVPYTSSKHALLTREWTPLEPGVVDHKLYLRGVGTALEETVKGGDERLALVSVRLTGP